MYKTLAIFIAMLITSCSNTTGVLLPSPDGSDTMLTSPQVIIDQPAPSGIGIDESVFSELQPQVLLACTNSGTGPYYRVQSDPAKTKNINFSEGDLYIPNIKSVGNNIPYAYLGGQPKVGAAVDAGLYADENGTWGAVVNVAKDQIDTPKTEANGNTYVYRFSGGQTVHMKFAIPKDGQLSLDLTGNWVKYQKNNVTGNLTYVGVDGISTRTIIHPRAIGWKQDGTETVMKVMTTIAFRSEAYKDLTGDFDNIGTRWSGLTLGLVDKSGKVINQKPFNYDLAFKDCAAPEDTIEHTPLTNLPNITASIKLRRLAKLEVKPAIVFNLRANPRKDVQSRIIVKNIGVPKSILYYETTPLGSSILTNGKLLQNAAKEVPFTVTCGSVAGKFVKKFDLIYSIGETFDKSVGSSKAGAQSGDLLYRTQTITVSLTCAQPVAQVTPTNLTLEASTPRGGLSAIAAGSSATQDSASLTIANVGDDGSILEYGRTRITTASTVAIVPILLPASVSSSDPGTFSAQSITVTPKFTLNPDPAYDDWVYGTLNPTQTISGVLEKPVGATAQDTYPSALECKKVGDSHDSYVVVPYLTGEVDSSGVPLTGQQRVKVTSRCTGPLLEFNGQESSKALRAGDSWTVPLEVSNKGLAGVKKADLATLEYNASLSNTSVFRLTPLSDKVAVGAKSALTLTGTCPVTLVQNTSYITTLTLTSNDLEHKTQSVQYTLSCAIAEKPVLQFSSGGYGVGSTLGLSGKVGDTVTTSFVVANSGSGSLVWDVAVSAGSLSSSGGTLAPSGSSTFTYSRLCDTSGTFTSSLTLRSNDPNRSQVNVFITLECNTSLIPPPPPPPPPPANAYPEYVLNGDNYVNVNRRDTVFADVTYCGSPPIQPSPNGYFNETFRLYNPTIYAMTFIVSVKPDPFSTSWFTKAWTGKADGLSTVNFLYTPFEIVDFVSYSPNPTGQFEDETAKVIRGTLQPSHILLFGTRTACNPYRNDVEGKFIEIQEGTLPIQIDLILGSNVVTTERIFHHCLIYNSNFYPIYPCRTSF